jgi:hypothetical protein
MDQGTDGSLVERVRTWLLMMVEAKPDVVNREFRDVANWREASGAWLSWIFTRKLVHPSFLDSRLFFSGGQ